ncbi:E3 ubiquitin-protein ligase ORTHRUS 2 [Punica granatum]|uniref:RING-type E3 ubiquitin transferase n=2 Tax=Punica granatum TaxID=22663 RepID=A0A6P8CXI9_PUNGR|nr:E3 ubiquitin-protein ligase ORTHRUS 2 [Punica granatum]
MAHVSQLPCDGDGICMVCKENPSAEETLTCKTCATPWHVGCLAASSRPPTMADAASWECPDCNCVDPVPVSAAPGGSSDLLAAIRAIEADSSLSEQEKARRRQELLCGGAGPSSSGFDPKRTVNDVLDIIDGSLNCSFCMQLPERPVTTPCGHNFCLRCFQKWVGQGKRTCANCRNEIPAKMASQPRINSALVMAIRMAKMAKSNNAGSAHGRPQHFIHNQNRPDKAFTTERAKRAGKANACSGKIFVTAPPDHFGPITAEYDPERNQGVLVGETWEDRMECRQWGAHLPHVAGIAGQSSYGAQSVCLSGGYQDDEDHGEWFLYTGSGGRDLTGNRRTNSEQSSEQKFEKLNEALRVSCKKGYPVRVVRSHKEKRSSYAAEAGVRYDGVYRIEKCWRKVGVQGFMVCRYLFVRCDNDPAPWASDEHGDRPRPMPVVKELNNAIDITERKGSPAWDYDEEKACWMWKKPPPISKKKTSTGVDSSATGKVKRRPRNMSIKDRLLKEFSCQICRKVMSFPITTPCAHNFCKACLEGAFAGKSIMRQRGREGRSLRTQKNIMKCPACTIDIADFLQNPQVNRELMDVIETLQRKCEEEENSESEEEGERATENPGAAPEDADDDSTEEIENPEKAENKKTEDTGAETNLKSNQKGRSCDDIKAAAVVDAGVAANRGKRVKVAAAAM